MRQLFWVDNDDGIFMLLEKLDKAGPVNRPVEHVVFMLPDKTFYGKARQVLIVC